MKTSSNRWTCLRLKNLAAWGIPPLAVLKVFAIPKNYSSVLLIAFGAMAILALPARANIRTGASANATCAGFRTWS
jgi:hypothetical protein